MTFREVSADDVDVLLGMMRQLYVHDAVPFNEERSRLGTLGLIETPDRGCLWLMMLDGEVAGYCVLTFGYSIEYYGRHGFIDELFVKESFRGQGLGGSAVEHASEFCRGLGMQVILLEVAFENVRAHALYSRLGFAEHGRRLLSKGLHD